MEKEKTVFSEKTKKKQRKNKAVQFFLQWISGKKEHERILRPGQRNNINYDNLRNPSSLSSASIKEPNSRGSIKEPSDLFRLLQNCTIKRKISPRNFFIFFLRNPYKHLLLAKHVRQSNQTLASSVLLLFIPCELGKINFLFYIKVIFRQNS